MGGSSLLSVDCKLSYEFLHSRVERKIKNSFNETSNDVIFFFGALM